MGPNECPQKRHVCKCQGFVVCVARWHVFCGRVRTHSCRLGGQMSTRTEVGTQCQGKVPFHQQACPIGVRQGVKAGNSLFGSLPVQKRLYIGGI